MIIRTGKALVVSIILACGLTAQTPSPAPTSSSATAPHIVIISDPGLANWPADMAIERLSEKFEPLLQADISGPVEIPSLSAESTADACRTNHATALLSIRPRLEEARSLKVVNGNARPYRNFMVASIGIYLLGCNNFVWVQSRFNNYASIKDDLGDFISMRTAEDRPDTRAVLNMMSDKAFEYFSKRVAENRDALGNGLRYGYFLKNGEKSAFFFLKPGAGGAVVRAALDFGTAARAGLKDGDDVVSLNGRATSGLSQDALDALVASLSASTNEASVLQSDGKTRIVRFTPEDVLWYAAHPLALATAYVQR